MIKEDEAAFICDMAETYHILNYKELDVKLCATLAAGLRPDSRIKTKLVGGVYIPEETFREMVIDLLNVILWTKTKDAEKGRNYPASIVTRIKQNTNKEKVQGFSSGDAFLEYRQSLIERIQHE